MIMTDEFVVRADNSALIIRATDCGGELTTITITPFDVAEFYSSQSIDLTTSVGTLAGLHGDLIPISQLADMALDWFQRVNNKGLRQAVKRIGLGQ